MNIALTDAASAKIRKLMRMHRMDDGAAVRVGVQGAGCQVSYTIDIVASPDEGDVVHEVGGVAIACPADRVDDVDGLEIDYGTDPMKRGFKLTNRKTCGGCSCEPRFSARN